MQPKTGKSYAEHLNNHVQLAIPGFEEFADPVARSTDPETAHSAAADALPRASAGRLLALMVLAERGPKTDFELAELTGWQQTSIGKRRGECCKAGLIVDTGTRRPSPSGSSAMVWEITPEGRAFLAAHSTML